ncbi:MAG: NUDIX hydrolase [Planctomycetes bacterium]|nr:NUDIX hydrolase [Planctomycetota bacterium]
MHREPLLALLGRYAERFPEDRERTGRILGLVRMRSECFERTCLPGHVTASAWILSADRSRFLLTHHRKLNRWLQLGGHADGHPLVHEVALREAREESGMALFHLPLIDGELVPLDVDVHWIPPWRDEPGHWHHDVRFLLVAGAGQSPRASDESHALRWFAMAELEAVVGEESLLRMGLRARSFGGQIGPVVPMA